MYRWNSNKGYTIRWYNHNNYVRNCSKSGTDSWTMSVFTTWWTENWDLAHANGFVATEDFDITKYASNFIKNIPKKAILYFDKSSKFPRAKLDLVDYKKCLKPEKADAIVLGKCAEVKCIKDVYHIFTDSFDVFAIKDTWLQKDFNNDWNRLENDKHYGIKFGDKLKILYSGSIQLVCDEYDTIKMFNDEKYCKPFIIDTTLDKIINSILPDPDLQSIKAIHEMLQSTDVSTVRLGALMASGFNINNWLLTFTTLLTIDNAWLSQEVGNIVALEQLKNTLNIKYRYGGLDAATLQILGSKNNYTEEDINLIQSFIRTIPEVVEEFLKDKPNFYISSIPFIPDEYKQ